MGSEIGERLIEGAKEALEIARGNQPAARVHFHGHAYVPENRWQPIETAPKDGKAILVYCDGTGALFAEALEEASMTTVSWRQDGWRLLQTGGWAEDSDPYPEPTHWQPLPPRPGELT